MIRRREFIALLRVDRMTAPDPKPVLDCAVWLRSSYCLSAAYDL